MVATPHAASLASTRVVARGRAGARPGAPRRVCSRAPACRSRVVVQTRASPSDSTDPSSGYAESERSMGDMEALMRAAIEAEDFENAAVYRDLLNALKNSAAAAVQDANERFYEAFRSGDSRKMRACWGDGDHVQCLHPGAACIGGAERVAQSWDIVFSGLPPGTGLEIDVEQTRVHAGDDWGFATCVEKVRSDDGVGTLAATNVFEKQAGEWKIVHHHAHGIQGIR
jgi:translation initiation factor 2A